MTSLVLDAEALYRELLRGVKALRATGEDPALAVVWQRYHLAQAALRGERPAFAGVDLRAAVRAGLEGKAVDAPQPVAGQLPAWLKPLASLLSRQRLSPSASKVVCRST